jgi:hypothetical protein
MPALTDSKVPGVYYFEPVNTAWLQVDSKTGMSAEDLRLNLRQVRLGNKVLPEDEVARLTKVEQRMGRKFPSQPSFTTWSGMMECEKDSPFANRLLKKCGGTVQPSGTILGYWTSPEDWPEMAAGRESPRPFSPTTHNRTRS